MHIIQWLAVYDSIRCCAALGPNCYILYTFFVCLCFVSVCSRQIASKSIFVSCTLRLEILIFQWFMLHCRGVYFMRPPIAICCWITAAKYVAHHCIFVLDATRRTSSFLANELKARHFGQAHFRPNMSTVSVKTNWVFSQFTHFVHLFAAALLLNLALLNDVSSQPDYSTNKAPVCRTSIVLPLCLYLVIIIKRDNYKIWFACNFV